MQFRFYRLRFHFDAHETIYFPPGKTGNVLRGAFGSIFRRLACVPECHDARMCEVRATCAYARVFEPSASMGESPSGLTDWPRPFVFRATHLDTKTFDAGDSFLFEMNLFQLHEPPIDYFVQSFAKLAEEGIGPGRPRAHLRRVEQIDPAGAVTHTLRLSAPALAEPSQIDLTPAEEGIYRITVRFLSPTELKQDQHIVPRPEFGLLMARIRDRLSTLSSLYGDGPLDMDFSEFGERAARVRMSRCEIRQVEVSRVSSRTGQRHPLGGFVGTAVYEGQLTEFVPFLRAAAYSGVGRQTTWGKGELALSFE